MSSKLPRADQSIQAVSPEEAKALMDAKRYGAFSLFAVAAHTQVVSWLN